jgi:hypothetical protein
MKYKREYFFCEKLADNIVPITAKRFYELTEQQYGKNPGTPVAFDLTEKKKKEDGTYELVSNFSAFSVVSPISEETSNILGGELDGIIRSLILAITKQIIPIIKEGLKNVKKEA